MLNISPSCPERIKKTSSLHHDYSLSFPQVPLEALGIREVVPAGRAAAPARRERHEDPRGL